MHPKLGVIYLLRNRFEGEFLLITEVGVDGVGDFLCPELFLVQVEEVRAINVLENVPTSSILIKGVPLRE